MPSIEELQSRLIESTVDDDTVDEMLNDCYPEVIIAGVTFYPSDIIKNLDGVLYEQIRSDMEYDRDENDPQYEYFCPNCRNWAEFDDDECSKCGLACDEEDDDLSDLEDAMISLIEDNIITNEEFVVAAFHYINMEESNLKVMANNRIKENLAILKQDKNRELDYPIFCTYLELWEWFVEYFKCAENKFIYTLEKCMQEDSEEEFPEWEEIEEKVRLSAIYSILMFLPETKESSDTKELAKEVCEIYLNLILSAPANSVYVRTNKRDIRFSWYDSVNTIRTSSRKPDEARLNELLHYKGNTKFLSNLFQKEESESDEKNETARLDLDIEIIRNVEYYTYANFHTNPWFVNISFESCGHRQENGFEPCVDMQKIVYAMGRVPEEIDQDGDYNDAWR